MAKLTSEQLRYYNRIRPQIDYVNKEGERIILRPKTYKEIKKNLKIYLEDSINNEVFVLRHRRGEWGEWWEYWKRVGNRNVISKQGWS